MTRMANGAQRSGAAMLSLVFTQPREDYEHASRILSSFFFCVSPTPARWLQGHLGARWPGGQSPGSVVLHGTGGRTAKHLKSNGSVVLFRNLTRDAHADACAHTRIREGLKLRTSEPDLIIEVLERFTGSVTVLRWFCQNRSAAPVGTFASDVSGLAFADTNKISGGYAVRRIAASTGADLGLDGAAARANFRAQVRGAAGLAASIEVGGAAGKNGRNQPFFGAADGRVGMPMLECGQETAENRASHHGLRKPARLAGHRLAGQLAPRGGGADREGGTPPTGPRLSLRPCAQPIFWISTDLETRRSTTSVADRDSRLSSKPEMGSGVCDLPPASDDRGACALNRGQQRRVGEQRAVLSWGRSRERSTLWGGLHRVN